LSNLPLEQIYKKLSDAVLKGDSVGAKKWTDTGLKSGAQPLDLVLNGLVIGMRTLGDRYTKRLVGLPQLMLAANTFYSAMEIIKPQLKKTKETTGHKVVIGTVQFDVHDVGKNLVKTMFEASGYEVHDLGNDVPVTKFIEKAKEVNADIIAASTLMTATMPQMEALVKATKDAGIRDKVIIMMGGAPISSAFVQHVGADGSAEDCVEAIKVADQLLEKKKSGA
jgi:dimethylamine corrinoid protein